MTRATTCVGSVNHAELELVPNAALPRVYRCIVCGALSQARVFTMPSKPVELQAIAPAG